MREYSLPIPVDDLIMCEREYYGDAALRRRLAAAGEADIGFARFARAVDDAADDRHGQWRRDVREPFLEPLDRLDDLELLPGAGRAGYHRDALAPEHQRLQQVEAQPSTGSRRRG